MIKKLVLVAALFVVGCSGMEPQPSAPVRPILTCEDCSGLEYYGPQALPTPDPRVQMAEVITRGITGVAGIGAGVYAATEMTKSIADAGKYVVAPTRTTQTSQTETVRVVDPIVVDTPRPEIVKPEIVKPEIIVQ